MQTITHLAVGAMVSRILFPDSLLGQAACTFGAILPDLPMVPVFIWDKIRGDGISSLTNKKPWLQASVEALHSLLVLIVGMILIPWLWPLWVGIFSHIVIDICTHSGEQFFNDDVTHLWPAPTGVKLGHLLGFWEYRSRAGDLTLKPEEKGFLFATCLAILLTIF